MHARYLWPRTKDYQLISWAIFGSTNKSFMHMTKISPHWKLLILLKEVHQLRPVCPSTVRRSRIRSGLCGRSAAQKSNLIWGTRSHSGKKNVSRCFRQMNQNLESLTAADGSWTVEGLEIMCVFRQQRSMVEDLQLLGLHFYKWRWINAEKYLPIMHWSMWLALNLLCIRTKTPNI